MQFHYAKQQGRMISNTLFVIGSKPEMRKDVLHQTTAIHEKKKTP